MLTNRRTVRIEWGDCDAANIVFYPRYFAFFDASTQYLFEAAGFSQPVLQKNSDFIGYPMVDTRARFIIPSTYGDDIIIESTIAEFRRSSFDVTHKVYKGEALAIEAWETRVWTGRHPDDPARMKSRPVPQEIIDRFKKG